MENTKERPTSLPVQESTQQPSELVRGAQISAVEAVILLLALCSFSAALYVLWRVLDSAVLEPSLIEFEKMVPWQIGVNLGVTAITTPGLIWVSFLLLRWNSRLASDRRLISAIENVEASPAAKLTLIAGLSAHSSKTGGVALGLSAPADESARVIAAGQWVLNRFLEGDVILSVPNGVADPKKLRAALGIGEEVIVHVLRP